MHEAEEYLRNPDHRSSLYVRIGGKRRRLFINRDVGQIGIIGPHKRTHGHLFSAWDTIEKIYYPHAVRPQEVTRRIILKYQHMAFKATFHSPYLRNVMAADLNKSLHENGITTGVRIDGQVISLDAVQKWCGDIEMQQFRAAVANRTQYHSMRFNFRGYDGSLWVEPCSKEEKDYQKGDIRAGFSKEFRGAGNGYYYILINDNNFIGYDVD